MSHAQKDAIVWEQWKQTPNHANMQNVLNQINPIVQTEVNRWAGTLARPALELEAKTLAVKAIQTYDPKRGASLGTHTTNQLRKLSRLPYTHQNLARVPEYQTLKYHTYNLADSALKDKLGRDPSVDELSSQLGWSKSYLNNFQKTMRKEFIESGEVPPIFDTDSGESGIVDFVYNDLSPVQKTIFERTTGYGGMNIMKNPQLMKKLKMSQGQLSYQKRLLVNKIEKLTGGGLA